LASWAESAQGLFHGDLRDKIKYLHELTNAKNLKNLALVNKGELEGYWRESQRLFQTFNLRLCQSFKIKTVSTPKNFSALSMASALQVPSTRPISRHF